MKHRSPTLFLTLFLTLTALPGCCGPFVGNAANDRLDNLVASYTALAITQRSCYSQPEPQRTQCYLAVSNLSLAIASSVHEAQEAIEICDQPGFEAAMAKIVAILFGPSPVSANLAAPVEEVDIQAQGSPGTSAATTIHLATGSTLRAVVAKGLPVMGPFALSGSFTTDLQPSGPSLTGPVSALAFTATMPNQPTWQLTLQNASTNRCFLGPVIGTTRNGNVMVFVRFHSGAMSWPMWLNIPVRVAADLSTWNFSTAGMVSAQNLIPTAVNNTRVGRGCPGSSGSIPRILNTTVPRVGDPLRVSLALAKPNSVAVLIVGESTVSWAGVPLPLDLAPFGAPGCSLHVSVALLGSNGTDAAGRSEITLPIPADPTLAGATIYQQWVVMDQANPLGAVMSGGASASLFAR